MANTVYTGAQAAARARAYSTYKIGYCLNFVWHCIDYPKVAGLASANAAWSAARQKVTSGTPPAGAPVYWSGGKYGHIAVSLGGGYCRSTDYPSKGRVGTVSIASLTKQWGLRYRGWSRDYAGKSIIGLGTSSSYPAAKSVDLSAAIHRSNLKLGKTHADVKRFELALWNTLGGPYRAALGSNASKVGDNYYGTLTTKMCSDAYAKFGLTRATEPGPVLLAKLGFKSVKA
jgi:hypothetical protein